jgi:hypothetical protein
VINKGDDPDDRREDEHAALTPHTYDAAGHPIPILHDARNKCITKNKKACFIDTDQDDVISPSAAMNNYIKALTLYTSLSSGSTRGQTLLQEQILLQLASMASQYWIQLNGICACSGSNCH